MEKFVAGSCFPAELDVDRLVAEVNRFFTDRGLSYSAVLDAPDDVSAVSAFLAAKGFGTIHFAHESPFEPTVALSVCLKPEYLGQPPESTVRYAELRCDGEFIELEGGLVGTKAIMVDGLRSVCRLSRPEVAWAGLSDSVETLVDVEGGDIRWLTYFGKESAERLGQERLLGAPVWRAERVGEGTMLILTPSPADLSGLEALKRYLWPEKQDAVPA